MTAADSGAHLQDLKLSELLDAVAARTPTPGGGAVASIIAGLASALARMVIEYSRGKKAFAAHEQLHASTLAQLQRGAARALELAAEDARAYGVLNELWKLDENDPRRVSGFAGAVNDAIAAPLHVLELAIDMLGLMQSLVGRTSTMLKSDLAIAAVLAEAAARSAAWNVRINLPLMTDRAAAQHLRDRIENLQKSAQTSARSVEDACA